MTLEEHESEVKKLKLLEYKLTNRISVLGDSELMRIYSEWSTQRNLCNEGFVSVISDGLNSEIAEQQTAKPHSVEPDDISSKAHS